MGLSGFRISLVNILILEEIQNILFARLPIMYLHWLFV